jgi:hypothetical protein
MERKKIGKKTKKLYKCRREKLFGEMLTKRGQAAMEYLMTYGWAILVIVIVLAALLYLGVFNIANKMPDVCTPQVGLQCNSWFLNSVNSRVNFSITNGYQQTINVTRILCQVQGETGTWVTETGVGVGAQQQQWLGLGTAGNPAIPCYDASGAVMTFSRGSTYQGKIIVEYYFSSEGSGMTRRNTADVRFTAQ